MPCSPRANAPVECLAAPIRFDHLCIAAPELVHLVWTTQRRGKSEGFPRQRSSDDFSGHLRRDAGVKHRDDKVCASSSDGYMVQTGGIAPVLQVNPVLQSSLPPQTVVQR